MKLPVNGRQLSLSFLSVDGLKAILNGRLERLGTKDEPFLMWLIEEVIPKLPFVRKPNFDDVLTRMRGGGSLKLIPFDDFSPGGVLSLGENGLACASQDQMATLFGCSHQNVSLHIKSLIAEGEIRPAQRFKSDLNLCNADAKTTYYDFRAVCSVGMRVSSIVGRAFRNYIIDHLEHLARHGWSAEPWFLEEMRAQRPKKDAEPENHQDTRLEDQPKVYPGHQFVPGLPIETRFDRFEKRTFLFQCSQNDGEVIVGLPFMSLKHMLETIEFIDAVGVLVETAKFFPKILFFVPELHLAPWRALMVARNIKDKVELSGVKAWNAEDFDWPSTTGKPMGIKFGELPENVIPIDPDKRPPKNPDLDPEVL